LTCGFELYVLRINRFSGEASRILDDTLIGIYSVRAERIFSSRFLFFSLYSAQIRVIFLHHFSSGLALIS
jgi:hypothetical protein